MGYDTVNKEIDMFRKSYTKEFKIRAVQLMGESSKPIRQLAEELGVSVNNLYNWRKQLREYQRAQPSLQAPASANALHMK